MMKRRVRQRAATAALEKPRVVSLLPFLTDIVRELKLDHLVVATSHECQLKRNVPSITSVKALLEQAEPLEVSAAWNQISVAEQRTISSLICSYYDIDVSQLAKLQPTHIFTHVAPARTILQPSFEEVEQAVYAQYPSVTKLKSMSATTLADIYLLHHDIATTLGVPAAAVSPLAHARLRLQGVKSIIDKVWKRLKRRPSVAVVQWTDPIYLAGGWIPEVLQIIGCDSPSPMPGPGHPSQQVPIQLLSNFDYVLFVYCAVDVDKGKQIANRFWAKFGQCVNVSASTFAIVDGHRLFSWLGISTIVRTAEVIAEIVTASPSFEHAASSIWQRWIPPR